MRLLLTALLFAFSGPALAEGWKKAEPGQEFEFPRDEYAHPDYRTEWWYFTGNVANRDGRRFGYQLTFFRQGIRPPGERTEADSRFVVNEFWFAHLAISDLDRGRFEFRERLSRGALGEAGSGPVDEPRAVWINGWSVERTSDGSGNYHLQAEAEGLALDLQLRTSRSPVLQGNGGYSPKSATPGNASFYYSHTRMETDGTLTLGGTSHQVEGLSWYDREWSTSALSEDQVGWDWFSIQLEDERDLMLFQLRDRDREPVFQSGTLVDTDGKTTSLTVESFQLEPRAVWNSPATAARYPIEWTVRMPEHDLSFRIEAAIPDQELTLGPINYWEGSIRVLSPEDGRLLGRGYLEMTGYSSAIPGLAD